MLNANDNIATIMYLQNGDGPVIYPSYIDTENALKKRLLLF